MLTKKEFKQPLKHSRYTGSERITGEPLDVFIDDQYIQNVGYLVQETDGVKQPQGTCFFVKYPLGINGEYSYYAVTCLHVVNGISPNASGHFFIRVNNQAGELVDIPTPHAQWRPSPSSDVSMARFKIPDGVSIWATPIDPDHEFGKLHAGHDIFFVGLFVIFPGLKSVQPVARTGKLARGAAEKCELIIDKRAHDSNEKEGLRWCDIFVAEVLSWGGESGSPVYLYEEHFSVDTYGSSSLLPSNLRRVSSMASHVKPPLFGMVHGHFLHGLSEGIATSVGIMAIIPVSAILELLKDGEFEKLREIRRREITSGQRPKPGLHQ